MSEHPTDLGCEWNEDADGVSQTACGRTFALDDSSGAVENGLRFCHFCGKRIRLMSSDLLPFVSEDGGDTFVRASSLAPVAPSVFDFRAHLARQAEFSQRTFGPGVRTAGVVDHIRKELREIEAKPHDLSEWIDVVILGLDGAWRAGYSPDEIVSAIVAKQAKNEARTWPDWRTAAPDKAIEHVREAARDRVAPPSQQNAADCWECQTSDDDEPCATHQSVAPPSGAQATDKGGETHAQFVARLPSSPLPRSTEGETLTALLTKWRELAKVNHSRGVSQSDAGNEESASYSYGTEHACDECARDLDAILTARASSPPPPVSPDWQPIETAPKDTRVIASFPKYGVLCAVLISKSNTWVGQSLERVGEPTHWMPLPVPPSASGPSKTTT